LPQNCDREIWISLERWLHGIRRTMEVATKREAEQKEEVKKEEVGTTTVKKVEGKTIAGVVIATIRYRHKSAFRNYPTSHDQLWTRHSPLGPSGVQRSI
jgi:hypothetical protein